MLEEVIRVRHGLREYTASRLPGKYPAAGTRRSKPSAFFAGALRPTTARRPPDTMLESFKRWLIRDAAPDSQWSDAARWAKGQGYRFKRTKEDDGFVIDGAFDNRPWRLEWGPPQRSYIASHELRLRLELHLPPSYQMLVMSQALMEKLERETFERYTDNTQTQIDVTTPEEMRWLAMFPKVELSLPRDARAHFAAVGIDAAAAAGWFDLELSERLVQASETFLRRDPPFVMMTLRGRVYLRLQLESPDTEAMALSIRLLEAAAHSALRLAHGRTRDKTGSSKPESTLGDSTAWQSHLSVEDPPSGKPRR